MPLRDSISSGIKLRLAGFILAIAAMVALIAWTAYSSWQRASELRERLTTVQFESFQIADHFQQSILGLNNTVLRYGVDRNPADWQHFEKVSQALDHWIDDQRSNLPTDKERGILDLINTNYDSYLFTARQIHSRAVGNPQSPLHLVDFADFEKQSQDILNLAFQLASAHRQSKDSFFAASKKVLNYLSFLLLCSLTLLLLAGGGLAVVVYRELIAPLRVKLVESQALVERQEKLASLGMLAAGVAHEIRNPLTAIKAWLFIQQKHLQPGTAEHTDCEVIANELNRLERIVRDVLLFARPSEPQWLVVPAHEPLAAVQRLLSPQLQQDDIRLVCEDSLAAQIRIDPEQIKQVLINLVQNAAESIGRDGTVTLRARLGTLRRADGHTDAVVLEVVDTGKGIPAEVEKRLFDPFFTTKESGTGLGLSIAARIVEKHGGALQYQTQVHRGTTFGVVLPRAR